MDNPIASISSELNAQGTLLLKIDGRLDSYTLSDIWSQAMKTLDQTPSQSTLIDASGINYCDLSGAALFVNLHLHHMKSGRKLEISNLHEDFQKLLDLFPTEELDKSEIRGQKPVNVIEEIGRSAVDIWNEITDLIAFLGESVVVLSNSIINPKSVRWSDVFITSEKIGVNAFFIVALVTFLIGLVIAFQSAIPLKAYGGAIFVADLTVLSVFRELGPLMTAIVINGRTGSAFAAEIGTMKVNEEVDALTTMGLDPVRFLVVPKYIAALIMIPILTVFADFFGLLGGGVVMLSLGFPPIAYINELLLAATYVDFLGGLFKSLFFAMIIAGVGCMEGLRTKTGASAVGDATTSAVVGGIVLIILVDGIFGVLYYYLGI